MPSRTAGDARLRRANASPSARSASRSSRLVARRVLISSTTVPSKPSTRQALEHLRAGLGAAAGHQVLVLVRADAVGEVHVGEPVAERVERRDGVGAGHGGVRQVEGHRRVVELERVPVRQVGRDLAATGPPREHVLDREDDVGLVLHPGQAVGEPAGVLALPQERRVHDDGRRADPLGRLLGADAAWPTGRCSTPAGSAAGTARGSRGSGMANRSDRPRSASGSWLTGSVQTITSTPSKPRSAAISNAVVHDSG